ncbi:MAG: SRPBCC domain-containing protein [Cytophagales bacterium]|nr:SRPBCC domain-containing protein [Cytophagales bacterium]
MSGRNVVVERVFDAPVKKVWQALTVNELMKQWHFDVPGFKAEKGFKFEFTSGPSPERQYVHLCEIVEVIPERKLAHTWMYKGYEGSSTVMFELFDEGGKTRLKLTHSGIDSFPISNTDFARGNFEKGWTEIVNTSLKKFLEAA